MGAVLLDKVLNKQGDKIRFVIISYISDSYAEHIYSDRI